MNNNQTISTNDPAYPIELTRLLGASSPPRLELLGNSDLLLGSSFHKLALFSSAKAAQRDMFGVRKLARAWREALGLVVVSGFHSPAEAEAYRVLSRGESPMIVCPPRSLSGMRLKATWRAPLSQGRLLLLSFFWERQEHTTRENAIYRNRCLAALADQVVIAHARPGSKTEKLGREALGWGKQVYCLGIPTNRHLLDAGAHSLPLPLGDAVRRGPSPNTPDRSAVETRLRKLAHQVNASEPHRRIFHSALQTKIVDLATEFGLRAVAEYQIENVPPNGYRGRIDVVWLSGVKPQVAIEIDNKREPKSIHKLLKIDAVYKVWIYRGGLDPCNWLANHDPRENIHLIWLDPTPPASIRKQYPNAYNPWTKQEEIQLERGIKAGVSYLELSNLLGRQPSAIRSRVEKLGLERK